MLTCVRPAPATLLSCDNVRLGHCGGLTTRRTPIPRIAASLGAVPCRSLGEQNAASKPGMPQTVTAAGRYSPSVVQSRAESLLDSPSSHARSTYVARPLASVALVSSVLHDPSARNERTMRAVVFSAPSCLRSALIAGRSCMPASALVSLDVVEANQQAMILPPCGDAGAAAPACTRHRRCGSPHGFNAAVPWGDASLRRAFSGT
jgi:hypothetical protein